MITFFTSLGKVFVLLICKKQMPYAPFFKDTVKKKLVKKFLTAY